jgi:hypothetical protein
LDKFQIKSEDIGYSMDEVHFTLTADDFWRLQLHALSHRKHARLNIFLVSLIVILCAWLLAWLSSRTFAHIILAFFIYLFSILFILALIFGLSFLIMRLNASGVTRSLQKRGVHVASIYEQGLRQKNEQGEGITYWRAINAIEEDKHNLYFQLDNPGAVFTAFLIPKRAFENSFQAERFIERARGHWSEQASRLQ